MNKAQCLVCGMILESTYRHDFKCCTCGNVCVDGGNDYHKRSVRNASKYRELSDNDIDINVIQSNPTYDKIESTLENGVTK